jgi:hypothetical protein
MIRFDQAMDHDATPRWAARGLIVHTKWRTSKRWAEKLGVQVFQAANIAMFKCLTNDKKGN